MSKEKTSLRTKLSIGALLLLTSGIISYGIKDIQNKEMKSKVLYQQVDSLSNSEWSNVYNFLGKKYRPHFSDPKTDLSIKDMQNYINEFGGCEAK